MHRATEQAGAPNTEEELFVAARGLVSAAASGRLSPSEATRILTVSSAAKLDHLESLERAIRGGISLGAQPAPWPIRVFKRSPAALPPWLALCDADGHSRERALWEMKDGAPNAFFYAIAVRRLNDWVLQVRQAARQQLPMLTRRTAPEDVVEVLCAVLPHWSTWRRSSDSERHALIEASCQGSVLELLLHRLRTSSAGPMPVILAEVSRAPSLLRPHLDELAAKAVQPAVRRVAYRCLLEGKARWTTGHRWIWLDMYKSRRRLVPTLGERPLAGETPYADVLQRAARDSSAMVRNLAGEFLIRSPEQLGGAAPALAIQLANDPNASVAERGRFAVQHIST